MRTNIVRQSSGSVGRGRKRTRRGDSLQKLDASQGQWSTAVLKEGTLNDIFSGRAGHNLEHLSRCFEPVQQADANSKTLLSMWQEMKDSKQTLNHLRDATSTYGKMHIATAKTQKWIGDCLTGFATYYECTCWGGRECDPMEFRWAKATFRAMELVSLVAGTVGDASLIILSSLARMAHTPVPLLQNANSLEVDDCRLNYIAKLSDKNFSHILKEWRSKVVGLLHQSVCVSWDRPALLPEGKMIPLFNPVAFVAWWFEET